jgi:hypothetical protein
MVGINLLLTNILSSNSLELSLLGEAIFKAFPQGKLAMHPRCWLVCNYTLLVKNCKEKKAKGKFLTVDRQETEVRSQETEVRIWSSFAKAMEDFIDGLEKFCKIIDVVRRKLCFLSV